MQYFRVHILHELLSVKWRRIFKVELPSTGHLQRYAPFHQNQSTPSLHHTHTYTHTRTHIHTRAHEQTHTQPHFFLETM